MAYCTEDSLLIEGLPLSTVVNPQKYIDLAADEMNIILGQVYNIPIVYDDTPDNLQTKLFLKQVNSWLASGRMIIAATASNESTQLSAYGRQLVNGALKALNDLVGGGGSLPGVQFSAIYLSVTDRVLQFQQDETSHVIDFENRFYGPGGFTASKRRFPW